MGSKTPEGTLSSSLANSEFPSHQNRVLGSSPPAAQSPSLRRNDLPLLSASQPPTLEEWTTAPTVAPQSPLLDGYSPRDRAMITEGDVHPEFFAEIGLLTDDPSPGGMTNKLKSPRIKQRKRVTKTSTLGDSSDYQPDGMDEKTRQQSVHDDDDKGRVSWHKKAAYFLGMTETDPREREYVPADSSELSTKSSDLDSNIRLKTYSRKRIPVCRPFVRVGKSLSRNGHYFRVVMAPLFYGFLKSEWRGFKTAVHPSRLVPGLEILTCLAEVIIDVVRSCCGRRRKKFPAPQQFPDTVTPKRTVSDKANEEGKKTDETVAEEDWTSPVEDKNVIKNEFDPQDPENYPNKELLRSTVLFDAGVGLSVGAMSIPQGMSYAMLAELPPEYGLFNNLWYPLIYFFLGTSRHAVMGVSAVENLMIGESITKIVGPDAPQAARLNCAFAMSLVSGLVFLFFRFLKLAVVADLLADPVLSGFSTGSAFIVGTSQVKWCLGIPGIKSEWGLPKTWVFILQHIDECQGGAMLVAFVCLVCLTICKKINQKWCRKFPLPGPLIIVIGACMVSYLADLDSKGIQTVGYIPAGFAAPEIPKMTFFGEVVASSPALGDTKPPACKDVLLQSIKLCIVFYIIHISLSKSVAVQKGYQVRAPQELVAFSGCDFIGSFFNCYPNCTSVSRTSVASTLGAKTHMHGLFACTVVFCVLLFLTVPLSYLPMSALGAIVIFGVFKMAEFGELKRLWRLQKASWASTNSIGGGASSPDLLLWLVCFLCTCLFGASHGILIAVIVSLIWLLARIVRPSFIELGRLPGTTIYRSKTRFPSAVVSPGIYIFRVDAPLCFCNATFLEQRILSMLREKCVIKSNSKENNLKNKKKWSFHHRKVYPQYDRAERKVLIVDCSSVNDLDVTAISALKRISVFAAKLNTSIAFANWKGPQRDFLHQANFFEIVPPRRCFLSIHDAVVWAQASQRRHRSIHGPEIPPLRSPNSLRNDRLSSPTDCAAVSEREVIQSQPPVRDENEDLPPADGVLRTRNSLPHVAIHLIDRSSAFPVQSQGPGEYHRDPDEIGSPSILRYFGEVGTLNVPIQTEVPVETSDATDSQEVLYEVGRDGSTRAWGRADPSENSFNLNSNASSGGD